jgi:hypothetical protein
VSKEISKIEREIATGNERKKIYTLVRKDPNELTQPMIQNQ